MFHREKAKISEAPKNLQKSSHRPFSSSPDHTQTETGWKFRPIVKNAPLRCLWHTHIHTHTHPMSSGRTDSDYMITRQADEQWITTTPLSPPWSVMIARIFPPFTQIPSTEIKWRRPLNNYITAVGIWSPLGLQESAIFDLLYESAGAFPQDGGGDCRAGGRPPSGGRHSALPSIYRSPL